MNWLVYHGSTRIDATKSYRNAHFGDSVSRWHHCNRRLLNGNTVLDIRGRTCRDGRVGRIPICGPLEALGDDRSCHLLAHRDCV